MTFLTRSRPACYTLGLPGSFWNFKKRGTEPRADAVTQVPENRSALGPTSNFLHLLATARGSARKQPRPTPMALGAPCLLIVTLATTELRFASRVQAIDQAATAVSELLSRAGVSEDIAFGIDMAVREAVTNAVVHGNKLDETKFIEISLKTSPGAFEIMVHDQGTGFNPDGIPDPTKEENILKTSGRGIFFMRNFMDEVEWSADPKGGTTVRMTRKI